MEADRVRRYVVPHRRSFFGVTLWALALGLPLALFGAQPPNASAWLMLLTVLALVADLGGRNGKPRLVLPFAAAAWWAFGPLAGWLVDLGALTASAVGQGSPPGERLAKQAFRVTLASVGASLIAARLRAVFPGSEAAAVLAPLGFSIVYLAAEFAAGRILGERSSRSLLASVLLPLLSVAAVVLVEAGAPAAVLLILGPVAALHGLAQASARLDQAHESTVLTLAAMLQRAHPYTHRHLERVANAAERVALRLGLGNLRAHEVRQAALLHDIGKIAIDEAILDAPRKLTHDEFEHVKEHAAFGGAILFEIDSMREIARWIRHHHERPDGSGYPQGLLDPEIPLESKIIAVVDAFDAMTGGMEGKDGRPFRPPLSQEEALAELDRCSGTQFDPEVVEAFRKELEGGLA